jgi:NTE family protein
MIPKFEQCKVGVALSGGGAKGIAHLGVLKALEDNEIHIDMLSGVSAGSIAGVLYADGHTPEDICDYLK